MGIPETGIGIIYFSGFESVIESNPDLIQVIEIEPQTFWYRYKSGLDSFVYDKEAVKYLLGLNKPVLFHGVGYPIGGTLKPDQNHLPCLKNMMNELKPLWISEHLSFNTVIINGITFNTSFLLPPLQTYQAIELISETIKEYADNFVIPFAFETGTNYLSRKSFELDDGDFVNQIAWKSDSYILLDLHNILANQKNGRQNAVEYIKQLSHEKIIQIHLAGGFYFKNYYLDAHSDVSSDEVLELFEKVVEVLPNLKAVTFEMQADYLNFIPEKSITNQLERMNRVWDRRGIKYKNHRSDYKKKASSTSSLYPTIQEWENTLGMLVLGKEPEITTALVSELQKDKGIGIIKDLIEKFKGSFIVSSLKLTCRYIMVYYSVEVLNKLLLEFWHNSVPQLFASDNGIDFADFLINCEELKDNQVLLDLISYEKSSMMTILDQKPRNVEMSFNPAELIPFLAEYELPTAMATGNYIITVVPEENYTENIKTVFHS